MARALRLYINEPGSNVQRIVVEICRLVMNRQTNQIESIKHITCRINYLLKAMK